MIRDVRFNFSTLLIFGIYVMAFDLFCFVSFFFFLLSCFVTNVHDVWMTSKRPLHTSICVKYNISQCLYSGAFFSIFHFHFHFSFLSFPSHCTCVGNQNVSVKRSWQQMFAKWMFFFRLRLFAHSFHVYT